MQDLPHKTRFSDEPGFRPFDKRRLSYASTFPNPWKAAAIRVLEWMTGKITLLHLIHRFEHSEKEVGQAFWSKALRFMGIEVQTPVEQFAHIPPTGPVVVVSNHPHGLVDGMVLGELIGRVRTDYKILTRSLISGISEVSEFLIPVPFPHEENMLEKGLEMRREAMEILERGGVVVLFPAGAVATTEGWWGEAVEREWHPFTARMICRSKATVVPIFFPGHNSAAYQVANHLSPVIRQGLLIHEIVYALNKPQKPVIGTPIPWDELAPHARNQTEFVAWLRARTLALKEHPHA
ncbi:MAG: lysophospholipid acyltransferase family protein [Pseudorhodobacter sp.]|nr:lysophospholipid acyltransferase family protein [Pseudorhodobacter sp.]